ncbi:right-handed parallel beta-helix repeat-containing protein [Agromyces salentinus]|uniref:Right handed beta helix domain-containing protein n=1 Tax=Agromyces salentinus TaxID=269421 RepID=A0ABN2MM90_9MICO|nr:right-handed parallel beta-helix repeat-containing protein [Agromyces salentinus]
MDPPAPSPPPRERRARRRVVVGAVLGLVLVAGVVVATVGIVGGGGGGSGATALPPIPEGQSAGAPDGLVDLDPAAGSSTPGSADYPVPADALFVDGGARAGESSQEVFQTIRAAVEAAVDGATIVIRGGEYHESVEVTATRGLTLQAYPGDEVWLDGSVVVEGWVADGSRWRHDDWTVALDSSPTFERGAPEDPEEGWTFVDHDHPMAAHPDQIWIDDVPLEQVADAARVGEGEFAVDLESQTLVVGSDPTGSDVRASVLPRALQLRSDGVTVRGIGIRRYATSVPDMGSVTLERPGITLENVTVVESATTGVFVGAADANLRNLTVERNGMIGISANFADGLVVDRVAVLGNNTESFNRAPVAGGMKLTRSRDVRILSSEFTGNNATGLWFDQSCYTIGVADSRFDRNAGHGLFLEISARAVVVRNVMARNVRYGVKVNDTSDVILRHNLLLGNGWGVAVLQDERRADASGARGLDRRFPQPDPTMTWVGTDVEIVGNTLVGGGPEALLWAEDYSGHSDAEGLRIVAEGNLYVRAGPDAPRVVVKWQVDPGWGPAGHETLAAFQEETGLEASGVEVVGSATAGAAPSTSAIPTTFAWPDWATAAFGGLLR